MGCKPNYPEDQIPAYLHIQGFNLSTDRNTQGSNTANITDVWAFVNGQSLGVYELPATFPVLIAGKQKLTLLPGIKKNGISNNRDDYFFYATYEAVHNFTREKTDTLNPNITYSSAVDFAWMENFDDLTFKFDTTSSSKVKLVRTEDAGELLEGKASGKILLNSAANYFEAASSTKLELNGTGLPVFLEMDYRCNQAFEVVLWGYLSNGVVSEVQVLVINSSTERYGDNYNKIYIDLAPGIGALNQATNYKLALVAEYDSNQPEGFIFIDNLKIVQ
jgi:hypothetical protein